MACSRVSTPPNSNAPKGYTNNNTNNNTNSSNNNNEGDPPWTKFGGRNNVVVEVVRPCHNNNTEEARNGRHKQPSTEVVAWTPPLPPRSRGGNAPPCQGRKDHGWPREVP